MFFFYVTLFELAGSVQVDGCAGKPHGAGDASVHVGKVVGKGAHGRACLNCHDIAVTRNAVAEPGRNGHRLVGVTRFIAVHCNGSRKRERSGWSAHPEVVLYTYVTQI